MNPSRRRFIAASAAAFASATGLGGYTSLIEPHWLEITRRTLPIRHLPSSLEGAMVAQLSDLHVGPRVSDAYILETFGRVRALAPDIVVYTGDFVSHEPGIEAHARRIYRDAPLGRLGTVGVFGNHDYGPGWRHHEMAGSLAGILDRSGIRILRNEMVDLGGLQVAGMDELWADRFDPVMALHGLDAEAPAIALSHNPDTADLEGWGGFDGWILSGHTHGGQCRPPFLPPPLLPVRNRRYTAGEFDLFRGRRMYISRGVGHLIRVRFNVRPEVAVFTLTGARG